MNKIGLIKVYDKVLNSQVNLRLRKKLDKLVCHIVESLDDENAIKIVKEMASNYYYDVKTVLTVNSVKKTRCKKNVDPANRCLARIGLGLQCSRSKSDDDVFCKSHIQSRPYGRIDNDDPPEKKMAKRRGRKSKNDKEYTIDDLDMDKYVQSILINIEGESYLLDQNNMLYHFNNNNEIVGHIDNETVNWY